jgi:hypothetical protein
MAEGLYMISQDSKASRHRLDVNIAFDEVSKMVWRSFNISRRRPKRAFDLELVGGGMLNTTTRPLDDLVQIYASSLDVTLTTSLAEILR